MDLEAVSTSIHVDTAISSDIALSCNKLLETQKQITMVEEQLAKLKDAESLLSEQTIPNLMQQAGIAMLKLADGSSVEVKPFYAARIPQTKVEEAFHLAMIISKYGYFFQVSGNPATIIKQDELYRFQVCEKIGFYYQSYTSHRL